MDNLIECMKEIVEKLPSGLSSEAHVVAEIYHKLQCDKIVDSHHIKLEWPYPKPNNKWKCDIFIKTGAGVWIEVKAYVKTETANTRSGKHTGEESSPGAACKKLKNIEHAKKILIVYQNIAYDPRKEGDRWADVRKLCENNSISYFHKQCFCIEDAGQAVRLK